MNLLIDCGNSSLKLALSKDLVIDESYSIEFRQIRTFKNNVKRLLARIKRQNKLDGIYIIYVNKEIETNPILKAKKLEILVEIIADYQKFKKLNPIFYRLITITANYRFVSSHLPCCHL